MPKLVAKPRSDSSRSQAEIVQEIAQQIQDSLTPDIMDLRALGMLLVQQVKDRFRTHGRSGSVQWRRKWIEDGRELMIGSGSLLDSWSYMITPYGADKYRITVYSSAPYAITHEFGTVGKGGSLPTIRPVKAKALFIPISDRAKASMRLTGKEAVFARGVYGKDPMPRPIHVATTGSKPSQYSGLGSPLKRGRIVKGAMEVWDEEEGEYKPGKPDFIFLKKVDIPPRPMLPTSHREQAVQRELIVEIINGRADSTGR